MADNVTLPGTGTVVAADDISSVWHQLVKVEYGADGSAALVSDTTPLPTRTHKTTIELTPTLETGAYADNDILFDAVEIANAALVSGRQVTLTHIAVTDDSDQKAGMILHFFDRTVDMGTVNSAPSISDADAAFFMGYVEVTVSQYVDLGGVSVAHVEFTPFDIKPNATGIFVAAILVGSAPTYAADALTFKFKFEQ